MRLLHLHWSHLLLRLARASDPAPDAFPSPVVLGGRPWDDGTVLDMDPAAAALGVRRGMSLGGAHRLVPEAVFLPPGSESARAAVDAALEALGAVSPGVAGASDPAAASFGLLEIQLDGLERLWGTEPQVVERARAAAARSLPGRPRAGIAGTRFAARIAAALAEPGATVAVPPGGEAGFLAPLSAELLTPDRELRGRLARLGLRRIGALADLPRSSLVARFGEAGAILHARARGEEVEPFAPRLPAGRLSLPLPVEPPVAELEPLRFLVRRLAGALVDQLVARGAATSRVRLHLELDPAFARRGTPTRLEIDQRLPEPVAETEAIERLLVARLERDRPPAPVARLELELVEVAPAAGRQLSLFDPAADRSARLAWQLARLVLSFGEESVRRLELLDPEAVLAEARSRSLAALPPLR
ncbi:MAG: hypothetical protein RL338_1697 [Chloroflexota bacterium]|jgi:protein ImuB